MTIYNGSTEDEQQDSIKSESANTKENRGINCFSIDLNIK